MTRHNKRAGSGPSQRQLKVGELLRGALVEALTRGHLRDPALQDVAITVTELRMSPDLRHARVYIMPLGGGHAGEVLAALNRAAGYLRHEVDRRVDLRVSPELRFELDESFEEAARIEALLRQTPPTAHD